MKTKNRFSSIVSRLSFLSNNEQRTTNNVFVLFLFSLTFLLTNTGWGQITEGFETGLPTSYNSTLSNVNLNSGTWQIKDVIAGTTGVNGGTKSAQIRSATAAQIISPTITGGVGTISFYVTASTTSGAYQVNISTDNGVNWSAASGSPFTIGTSKSLRTIIVNNSSVNRIQIYRTAATIYVDDFTTTSFSNSYTVTFDANGGSGSMANQTASTATNLTSNAFTRTGYTFAGWNTQANGSGTSYANGASYPFTSNTTLYAQWTANTLTVTYDSQGGSAISGSTTTTGGTVSDPGNPTRSGFTFNGWFVASSGGTAISFPYTHEQTSNFTLYAQWTAAGSPTLNGATLSSALTATYGAASNGVSFTAGGSNLTASITATPQSGYEISTSSGGSYQTTALSGISDGAILYVRLAATVNAGDYNSATAVVLSGGGASSSVNITTSLSGNTVSKASQTISAITSTMTKTFGDAAYSVATSASSGLTVTYSSSNTAVATVNASGTVTIVGAGSSTITAAQAGNTNYNAATSVTQALTVNKASQTITAITSTMTKTFGDAAYSVATSASSGLTVTYSSSNTAVATVNASGTVTIVGAGSSTITAAQSGNTNYNAATSVTQALTVNKASQTITGLSATDTKSNATATYNLAATASSGLSVSYTSSNTAVATITGSTVTIVGVGQTTITASQSGNDNYNAATSVQQTLTVSPSLWLNAITGTTPNLSNPFTTGDVVAGNITVSGIGRGSGISGSTANDRYNATTWNQSSLDANDYFYFTLTPAAGYEIDFTNFIYTGQASGTGPTNFEIRSSIDGYTNAIGSANVSGTTINLSGTSYQNITSAITFRFYAWGGTGGTFSINSFEFLGTVAEDNTPVMSASESTFTGFNYELSAGPSVPQTFTFSAAKLTPSSGNISVSATNYELSADGTNYTSSGILTTYTGGTKSNTTIYVRLKSGLSIGNYNNESVTISGGGASNITLTCSGSVSGPSGSPIASWDVSGQTSYGTSPLSPTSTGTGVTVTTGLTRGSSVGLSGTAAARGWGGTNWSTSATDPGTTTNVNVFFTMTVANGYRLNLNQISKFSYRRSGTGAAKGALYYKINSGAYNLITSDISFPNTASTGANLAAIDLNTVSALQNLDPGTDITFMIVPYNASGTGTWYIYDVDVSAESDFTINGTVTPVYSVTYNGNGNNLGSAPANTYHTPASTVTVSSNTGAMAKTTPVNYSFIGWNTSADGTGTFYAPGSGTFTISANTTLYARWAPQAIAEAPGSKIWVAGSGNWTTASNWLPSGVPASSDNVYIDAGSPILNQNHTVASGKSFTVIDQGSLTINPTVTLTIAGNADFNDRPVTLKSTSDGTAAIGQVTGTLEGATNVTVERYIPANRRWRALTAPLTGSTNNNIYDTWQNGGNASGNTGVMIWRPSATSESGLYAGGAATSILSFNSTGNSWTPLTSTKVPLFDGSGNNAYMVFVTGPYNTSGTYVTSGSAVTTLSATGTLRSGNIIYTDAVAQDKFYMFGNPYASAINLKTVTKSGFGSSAYLWNPSLGSVGGWNTISMGGTGTLPVQSGQAFFLYANNASNTLTFKESDKLTGSALSYFRNEQQVADGEMNIELNKYVDGKAELYDMATVTYKGGNSDRLPKLAQIYENLSVYQNGADFGVANRTLVDGKDNVQLRIWQMNEANYQLKINLSSMKLPAGTTAVLVDAFLNKETSLSLDRDNLVDFNVTSNAATSGQRFRIVLRRSSDIPVTSTDAPRFHIYPNPVEKGSAMQLEFRNKLAGKYTVTLFTIAGVQVQQGIVTHGGGNSVQSIAVSSRLSSGAYIAEITGANGVKEKMKVVIE